MNSSEQEHSGYGFTIGLLTGACIGAGLAMWFAPRSAAELRGRMTDTATRLGQRASERYAQAMGGTSVDDLARTAELRNDLVQAVAVLENEGNPPTAVRTLSAVPQRHSPRNASE